jgi:hypothetical protein
MDKLSLVEQRIRDRIERTKTQIHGSHNRAYIDSILIEIDTLSWVLNEISSQLIRTFYNTSTLTAKGKS